MLATPGLMLITIVDNAGITRVKPIPATSAESVASSGVGLSNVFAVMAVNDAITSAPGFDTPSGDVRLIPDLEAQAELPATGDRGPLLWAPANQVSQELEPAPWCTRHILTEVVKGCADHQIEAHAAFEFEFTLLRDGAPLGYGPGYGIEPFVAAEAFLVEAAAALDAQGLGVQQCHPEYAPGQYEISIVHNDPVAAADASVLLRITLKRIAATHGLDISFSPWPTSEIGVGNGNHVHTSLWRGGNNLFALDQSAMPVGDGAHAIGGVVQRLPEMMAVLTPSVISGHRLVPHHWAGAYACWGIENREAAVRLVPGTVTKRPNSTNVELKVVDASANPYLALAAIFSAMLDGIDSKAALPTPVSVDPDGLSPAERDAAAIRLLASDPTERLASYDASDFLRRTFGEVEFGAYRAVRAHEIDQFSTMTDDQVVTAHRDRY